MTKAKDFYMCDSKSKIKLDVVSHVNIKDFSWHQELLIKIPRKEIQWKSVFNPIFHSLSYHTNPSLHSQETTCITFLVYPTRVFLYENARKYRDFYISPTLHTHTHKSIQYVLYYSTLLFSFYNLPWRSFWICTFRVSSFFM